MPAAEEIRNYSPEDFPKLKDLFLECFTGRSGFESLEKLLGFGQAEAVLITKAGDIIAAIIFRQIVDEAEIIDICVHPSLRRSGCARKLIELLVNESTARQIVSVFLEVDTRNIAAQNLYLASGFVETGIRRGYYRYSDGTVSDALIMARKI